MWWVVAGRNGDGSQGSRASLLAQAGRESTCHAGDRGSVPGQERSPGEGNGYPLQYSCLGNSADRGAWTCPGWWRVEGRPLRAAVLIQQPGLPQVEAPPTGASPELSLFPPLVWAPEEGADGHRRTSFCCEDCPVKGPPGSKSLAVPVWEVGTQDIWGVGDWWGRGQSRKQGGSEGGKEELAKGQGSSVGTGCFLDGRAQPSPNPMQRVSIN